MPSTSIPTSRYPTPPVSLLADPFDFTKKESPSHFCNGDSVVSPPPSALHRIFTEEVDIWHEIMLYAWINGTLRLRQTCRLFKEVSEHRVLWCKFLRQFCSIHGVPPATYDLDRLTSAEIEHAVTRPYKFERRLSMDEGIRTYASNKLHLDTSFADGSSGWELSLDDVVETTALVRGGRFLIAVHNRHWLSCWDLWAHEGIGSCPSIGIWTCPGRVLRILVQQSADHEDTLLLAVYSQGEPDDANVPSENIIILSLNLDPRSGRTGFELITSTQLNVSNRACWTLDGDYVLVAGVLGAIAVWNWRQDMWAVAKLSMAENDGSLTGEELRAVRYPRVTMVGPDIFAVNYATDHGLSCHFLKLPSFHPNLVEAIAHASFSQVARVGLSFNYLVGVFLPSWRPISREKSNTLVQMLIWNDLRPDCIGRYVSLHYSEPTPPPQPTRRRERRSFSSASSSSSVLSMFPSTPFTSSGSDEMDTDTNSNTSSDTTLSDLDGVSAGLPGDVKMHFGPFVTLPRPGLFDETASGRLACIGCEDEIARSQIIDGPDASGVLPRVELGRCPEIKEFSYMDCWSGVLGVADLVDGGMTLRTFLF